jgi:hypothetical protein
MESALHGTQKLLRRFVVLVESMIMGKLLGLAAAARRLNLFSAKQPPLGSEHLP